MGRRTQVWLVGGWFVLVVAGWSVTEVIDDGIEPTSGPRPKPASSSSPSCPPTPVPTPTPTIGSGDAIVDYYVDSEQPDVALIVVSCATSD